MVVQVCPWIVNLIQDSSLLCTVMAVISSCNCCDCNILLRNCYVHMCLSRSYLLKKYDGAEFGYIKIQSNDYLMQRCSLLSLQYCTDCMDFTAFYPLKNHSWWVQFYFLWYHVITNLILTLVCHLILPVCKSLYLWNMTWFWSWFCSVFWIVSCLPLIKSRRQACLPTLSSQ